MYGPFQENCNTPESVPRGKRGQSPFVRSTLRAVPAKGDCPLFIARVAEMHYENQSTKSAHNWSGRGAAAATSFVLLGQSDAENPNYGGLDSVLHQPDFQEEISLRIP